MEPLVRSGTSIALSRCFEESDLVEGTVVLFDDNSGLRLGIIRHVLPLEPAVYKISDEKAPELLHDAVKEEIVGITSSIDVGQSKYQAKQKTESFILDSNEFLTDFYLAKIPRGAGIETSTIEKTTSFSRQQDKFCFVVVPKKALIGVGLEMVNTQTQEKTSLGENIIFSVSPKLNINCLDFGSAQGMLNLDQGVYWFKFLLNHQAIKNIQFEVK